MKEMLFVFNPHSGKEQIKGHLMEMLDIFTRTGYEIRIHVTQKRSDAVEVVHRYGNRVDLAMCSGGDGTLNETVSGMMKLKKLPPLGYIPAGSTNNFASSLEIPERIPQAASDIMEDKPLAVGIDTFCHDRYFMYIAAFGTFTGVSHFTSQDRRNLLGYQACMIEGIKSLADLKPHRMKVEWEDQVLEKGFAFGMVTSTRSIGSFKGLVNQSVALNDRLFEVLLTRMPRAPVNLSNIVPYMFLKEEPNEYVYKFKTPSTRMTPEWGVDQVLDGKCSGTRTEVNAGSLRERVQAPLKK